MSPSCIGVPLIGEGLSSDHAIDPSAGSTETIDPVGTPASVATLVPMRIRSGRMSGGAVGSPSIWTRLPRAACVEFGQHDGITTPEWTAYAWKQVVWWRDRPGLSDRISLAHYDGVHEVHAVQEGAWWHRDRALPCAPAP